MFNRTLNFAIYLFVTIVFVSCHSNMSGAQKDEDSIGTENHILIYSPESSDNHKQDTVMIFGVTTISNEKDVLENLQKNRVLTFDTISSEDNIFDYVLVDFAGVKFGMNKGFTFITSRNDKAAVKAIVKKISEYYGDPWIDEEDEEEPQYQYYFWNTTNPDKPSIRVRPLHSDEGGLVMFWEF